MDKRSRRNYNFGELNHCVRLRGRKRQDNIIMAKPGVLFIIENLPVPIDRRVLLESSAIREEGLPVYIICPRDRDRRYRSREVLPNGIRVFRYPPPPQTKAYLSYFFEFFYCLLITFLLASWVYIRYGFTLIHTANPPDTFFIIGLLFRPLGVRFVFDQHDLCPELFMSRFRRTSGSMLLGALRFLEKCSYTTADLIIVPNRSYMNIAIERGRISQDKITIVRSGPDLSMLIPRDPKPELKMGAQHLILYLGVMGPQDGLEILLGAFHQLLTRPNLNRNDFLLVLIGDGDLRADLEQIAKDLDIVDRVIFTGFLSGDRLMNYLATGDLGVSPDPPTPFNDKSTMNKILEYMAFGIPSISFDLAETRYSADQACFYVTDPTPSALAEGIYALLSHPQKRIEMGKIGRERILNSLNWDISKKNLVGAYRKAGFIPIR
jgi:glycosyltransferase involved in cell wall biosynthesis